MTIDQPGSEGIAGRLPRHRLLLLLRPITRFCCDAVWFWQRAPRWANRLRDAYTKWFLTQTLAVRLSRAAAQGVGFTATALPAHADRAAVIAWFAQELRQSRRVAVAPFDSVTCYVYRSPGDDGPVHELIGRWRGDIDHWEREGVEAIARLVPATHAGLHLVVGRLGELFAAANDPYSV